MPVDAQNARPVTRHEDVWNARRITWPEGKQFAFTIVDDTDKSTIQNVGPVYDFLIDHGLLTTKTVWPLAPVQKPLFGGCTMEEPCYREWVVELQKMGVEIAFHGATDHSSPREMVVKALDRFRNVLGRDPSLYVMHGGQMEALYWGNARLDGAARTVYWIIQCLLRRKELFMGHVEGTPYFWGDVCRDRITYMRNFGFRSINTLSKDPMMPYHDPRRPYVKYWFSSSEGANIHSFCRLLTERNQDRLMAEGGACIVYTHFANGFTDEGRLNAEFRRLIRRVAELPGWFVPASTLLGHLSAQPGRGDVVNRRALSRMQWEWFLTKLRHGRS
jgi:hypothetical protein